MMNRLWDKDRRYSLFIHILPFSVIDCSIFSCSIFQVFNDCVRLTNGPLTTGHWCIINKRTKIRQNGNIGEGEEGERLAKVKKTNKWNKKTKKKKKKNA